MENCGRSEVQKQIAYYLPLKIASLLTSPVMAFRRSVNNMLGFHDENTYEGEDY